MKSINLFLFLFASVALFSQEKDSESNTDKEKTYLIVEQMPEFPGGELALRKYIINNLVYPDIPVEEARQMVEGRLYIRFVVTKSGDIGKVLVARGVHPLLDKAGVDVIKKLPKWKPGMQRGKPVNVWYTVPVRIHPD